MKLEEGENKRESLEVCRLADPVKAGMRLEAWTDGEWSHTHTSIGITTYLLIRNKHFGIERRRLRGMRIGQARVSARVTDGHILVIYGSKRTRWSGGLW